MLLAPPLLPAALHDLAHPLGLLERLLLLLGQALRLLLALEAVEVVTPALLVASADADVAEYVVLVVQVYLIPRL